MTYDEIRKWAVDTVLLNGGDIWNMEDVIKSADRLVGYVTWGNSSTGAQRDAEEGYRRGLDRLRAEKKPRTVQRVGRKSRKVR